MPAGAGAGFGVTGGVEGLWQGDGAQIRVAKSPNGKYLGSVAAASTIQGCPATKDHVVWIASGTFEVQTAGSDTFLRVCTGEPSAGTPAPTSSAAPGTLPAMVGARGCADLKQVVDVAPAAPAHTVGDYVKVAVKTFRGKTYTKTRTLHC